MFYLVICMVINQTMTPLSNTLIERTVTCILFRAYIWLNTFVDGKWLANWLYPFAGYKEFVIISYLKKVTCKMDFQNSSFCTLISTHAPKTLPMFEFLTIIVIDLRTY